MFTRYIKHILFCLFSAALSTQLIAENKSTSPSSNVNWFSYQESILVTLTVVELFSDNKQKADRCSQRAFS